MHFSFMKITPPTQEESMFLKFLHNAFAEEMKANRCTVSRMADNSSFETGNLSRDMTAERNHSCLTLYRKVKASGVDFAVVWQKAQQKLEEWKAGKN